MGSSIKLPEEKSSRSSAEWSGRCYPGGEWGEGVAPHPRVSNRCSSRNQHHFCPFSVFLLPRQRQGLGQKDASLGTPWLDRRLLGFGIWVSGWSLSFLPSKIQGPNGKAHGLLNQGLWVRIPAVASPRPPSRCLWGPGWGMQDFRNRGQWVPAQPGYELLD